MIAQIAKGDRAAFDALYDSTSAKLYALCVTILNDRPAAESTLQDVYVAVWKQARNFSDFDLQPMTWLVSITRARAIARLRASGINGGMIEKKPAVQLSPATAHASQAAEGALPTDGPLAKLEGAQLQNLRDVYLRGLTYEDLSRRGKLSVMQARGDMKAALLGIEGELPKLTPAQSDQFLAAELVLALLDDSATEAALDRKSDDPDFAGLVRGWQEYFVPLAVGLTPIMAPARARQGARETLGLIAAPLTEDPTEETPWYRGRTGIVVLLLVVVAVLAYLWQSNVN
nr:sigma factor [Paracoccus amoyensis]